MKSNFVYIVRSKSNHIPVGDVAFSRSEARDMKNMYEALYKDKYRIERFQYQKSVR